MKSLLLALMCTFAFVNVGYADDIDDALAICAKYRKTRPYMVDRNDPTEDARYAPGFAHCGAIEDKKNQRDQAAVSAAERAKVQADIDRTKALLKGK